MRVLGLDIGAQRCGIASGDTATRIAAPVKVLASAEVFEGAGSWKAVLQDYEPDLLVCGMPFSLDGEEGRQAQQLRRQAVAIADAASLDLEFFDERLSSAEAKRILREQGLTEREMRGKVDMIAASLFLQTWLDRRAQVADETKR